MKKYWLGMKRIKELTKPWYDAGLVSIFNFWLPKPIARAGGGYHYRGQPQWTIQCLYLAKAYGDEFTLNTDMDEFLVFHNNMSIYNNLRYKYYDDIMNKCWVIFNSYNVWKLTNPNEPYLVPRFSGIFTHSGFFSKRCKSLWHNKYLWSAEVHAGGSCTIDNDFGFDWTQPVRQYQDWYGTDSYIRLKNRSNPTKLVKTMNTRKEASIRHYVNARHLRFSRYPDEYTYNDTCLINNVIWKSIKNEFEKMGWKNVTYDGNNTIEFDILYGDEKYIKLFGSGNSMDNITGDRNALEKMNKLSSGLQSIPVYESLICDE